MLVPGKIPPIEVYDLRANLRPNVEVTSNVTSQLIYGGMLHGYVRVTFDDSYHMYLIVNGEVRYFLHTETIRPRDFYTCWLVCIKKTLKLEALLSVAVRSDGYARVLEMTRPYIRTIAGAVDIGLQSEEARYNTQYMPYVYQLKMGVNSQGFAGWVKKYAATPSKLNELFQEQYTSFIYSLPPVEHIASMDIVTIEQAPNLKQFLQVMLDHANMSFFEEMKVWNWLETVNYPRHPESFAVRQGLFRELEAQNRDARRQLIMWMQTEITILQQASLHNIEAARQALVLIEQANGILLSNPNQPELRNRITMLLRRVSEIDGIQQVAANNPAAAANLRQFL
jgi:hypothetical protein